MINFGKDFIVWTTVVHQARHAKHRDENSRYLNKSDIGKCTQKVNNIYNKNTNVKAYT